MADFIEEKNYWENRYKNDQTDWDAGSITTPLKEYFDQLSNKNLKILIPGGGNSYEAGYLHNKGFRNVFVLDIAIPPKESFFSQYPNFPPDHWITDDFFNHTDTYDLIIEQTFFCAISPELRPAYAKKCAELLKEGGKLAGVLFNCSFEGGPPYGGNDAEYMKYFEPYFRFKSWSPCYNSIKPRRMRELFMILERKFL